MAELTAAEAAVYDRQLRVWGVETQKRLSGSKVLIVGCNGLAAEVAKNIVLAGVGSLTLVDDTPVRARAEGNFLVPADVDPGLTVSQACTHALQEMNPLVKVACLPEGGSPAAFVTATSLAGFDVLLLAGQPAEVIERADRACAEAGVALYAAVSRGVFGWAFANLHRHSYVVENKAEQRDGSVKKTTEQRSLVYVPWAEAMTASSLGRNLRRISPLFLVLQVCMRAELQQKRAVDAADVADLHAAAAQLCQLEGLAESAVDLRALEAYASCEEEMPAISAVVGGVVANDLLKAVAAKGEPLVNNLFLYSLADGAGWVERAG